MRARNRYPSLPLMMALVGACLTRITQAAPDVGPREPPRAIASPLSPADSLAHMHVDEGLRVELVACEPLVVDPVAIRFDELGNLWVVEMRDYPNPPPPGQPALSRISVLQDRDGDGQYETSTVFKDELLLVTGLQPWRGGVIVTLSGRIAWMKDTTGDGRADVDETWFTGFTEENPQLRVNHPRFALDNGIYVSNGLRGGSVVGTSPEQRPPISISGRDFRFDPRTRQGEAVSGHGQFGLTLDEFGNRFNCSNRNPLMHVVLADRYLARNPLLAVPSVTQDVMAAGETSRLFPLSRAWTTSILHAGQFTAACGVEIYKGDLLPGGYQGNGFTCDPTGNLVHREVLTSDGATFSARPVTEGVEFLASPDTWFRPVNLELGPDGALYVVDMYRAVIEHPQWVPDELKVRPDERFGDDRGRIYRVVPEGRPVPNRTAAWGDLTSRQLVARLGHANAWQRETAARLLYERQDKSVAPELRSLATQALSARSRVQALWTMAGLQLLDPSTLASALGDPDPRVIEQAVLLCEPLLAKARDPLQRIVDLADHPDARLRFQVALTLGEVPGEDLSEPLTKILLAGLQDPWTRRAVASSLHDGAETRVLENVLQAERHATPPAGMVDLVAELAELVAAGRVHANLLRVLSASPTEQADSPPDFLDLALLRGLARGLRSRGERLRSFAQGASDNARLLTSVDGWLARCEHASADAAIDVELRMQSLDLLAEADLNSVLEPLKQLLETDPLPEVRLRAAGALAAHADSRVATTLVENLRSQTSPALRRRIVNALLDDAPRAGLLLDEVQAGEVRPTELDPVQTGRLLENTDAAVRERATRLLANSLRADRAQVLAEYQAALKLDADAARGREVFRKHCITCHRIGDLGVDVAPSIADERTKTREQLLVDILQPSRAVDNNYLSYTVVTSDGLVHTGIITSETGASVTLKQAEGKTISLLRADIDEIRSSGTSLMPDGLERNIPLADMADLLSFIKNWRYLGGEVPIAPDGTRGP